MALALYSHPFASYCWKALIALYENEIPFDYRNLEDADAAAARAALWPFGRFPILVDDGRTVAESTIIIEHLDLHHRGATRWLADDPDEALEIRFMDRFFDNYVMTPMQQPVSARLTGDAAATEAALATARAALDIAYGWLDARLADRAWAAGERFTMADCAAAPSLFYADWVHPIADRFAHTRAYRAALLARPAVARTVDEARSYRHYFPLGAPDRD